MWIALAVCLCNLIPAHAETMESGSIVSKEYYQENQNQSEKRDDVDIMLLGQFGYNTAPQISYGLMFGVTKNHFGFYVKYMSDFNSLVTNRECDNLGYDIGTEEILYFYDESNRSRISATAGYICQPVKSIGLMIYGGLGYGYRTLAWHERYDDVVMVSDHSFEGIAADLGAIYKVSCVAFSVGVTAVEFKYCELNVGVGFIF